MLHTDAVTVWVDGRKIGSAAGLIAATESLQEMSRVSRVASEAAISFAFSMSQGDQLTLRRWLRALDPAYRRRELLRWQMRRKGRPGWKRGFR
jgi:hypothetical protein